MCQDCIVSESPDRGSAAYDTGAYMVNFRQCAKCGTRGPLAEARRTREESEDGMRECVRFDHQCPSCAHVIASHTYTFRADAKSGFQKFTMACELCGDAEDTASIEPVDPRLVSSAPHQ
eukprot:m51a1_g11761 putative protein churchill (119) ;mRNA; r:225457-225813